jgi:hypothetical protein
VHPFVYKRRVGAPPNDNHNINCHEQYKNRGRRVIILREV